MSNPSLWLLAPVTSAQVAEIAAPFERWTASVSTSAEVVEGLRVWSTEGDPMVSQVQDVFWRTMVDWPLALDLASQVDPEGDGVQILIARKLSPVAVLLSGLGWERAGRLPGVAGSWLLDPGEVRAAAEEFGRVFALSPGERSTVLDAMSQAAALGDQPDLDLDRLLDAVPFAVEAAVRDGVGLVSCTAVVE